MGKEDFQSVETDPTLPDDFVNESAQELFEKILRKLRENNGFCYTVAKQFLTSPLERGADRAGVVEFQSNLINYKLSIDRASFAERVMIGTINEDVEENMSILIAYKEEVGGERGEIQRATISYSKMDLTGAEKIYRKVNSAEAISKVRRFIKDF